MKKLIPFILNILTTAGIIYGHWLGHQEASNLVISFLWILSALTLITIFIPSKEFFKQGVKKNILNRIFGVIIIILLIAAGWWFTAIIYTTATLSMIIKKSLWIDELKTQAS